MKVTDAYKKMTRQKLIETVALGSGITEKQAAQAVDIMLGTIRESLAKRDKVALVGFGHFSEKRSAPPREGIGLRKDRMLKVPAKKVPSFRKTKGLIEKV